VIDNCSCNGFTSEARLQAKINFANFEGQCEP